MARRASSVKRALSDMAPARLGLPLHYLGFGFYWIWLVRLWSDGPASPLVLGTPEETTAVRVIVQLATTVPLLAAAAFAGRLNKPIGEKALLACGAVLGPVGTALALLGRGRALVFEPYLVAAWIAIGLSCACITLLWGRFYSSIDLERASLYMPASLVLAGLGNYVILALQTVPAIIVTVALPLIAAAAYMLTAPEIPSTGNERGPSALTHLQLLWRIVLAMLVYGVVIGFFLNARPEFERAISTPVIQLIWLAVPIAILLAVRKKRMILMYKLVLPLTAAGFLLMPLLGARGGWIGGSAITAGSHCFDILTWIALSDIAYTRDLSPMRVFGLGRAANTGGIALGWTGSFLLLGGSSLDSPALLALSLGIVFVLILTATLIFTERNIFAAGEFPADPAIAPQLPSGQDQNGLGHWRQRCLAIARSRGLSPREEEVMLLLARGHGIQYVQNALVITYSTAKAHTNHIYKKLGIHSRQELIDLVERQDDGVWLAAGAVVDCAEVPAATGAPEAPGG